MNFPPLPSPNATTTAGLGKSARQRNGDRIEAKLGDRPFISHPQVKNHLTPLTPKEFEQFVKSKKVRSQYIAARLPDTTDSKGV